jgi:hypothetical protein
MRVTATVTLRSPIAKNEHVVTVSGDVYTDTSVGIFHPTVDEFEVIAVNPWAGPVDAFARTLTTGDVVAIEKALTEAFKLAQG